jgi:hypothetical protein
VSPGAVGPPPAVQVSWRPRPPVPKEDAPVPGDDIVVSCSASVEPGHTVGVVVSLVSGGGCLRADARAPRDECQAAVGTGFSPERASIAAVYVSHVNTAATLSCAASDGRGVAAPTRTVCIPVSYPVGAVRCP